MGRLVWKNIRNFVGKCRRDNVGAFAAQAAFFILLSAIPFLLFLSALLPYTPVSREDLIEAAAISMPDYVEPFFVHVLDEAYDRRPGVLSVTALLAVWAAGKAIQYLEAGLNAVNGMYETRRWLVIRFWSVIYTLVFVLALLTVLTFFCLFRLPVSDAAGGRRAGFPDSSGQAVDPVDRALFSPVPLLHGALCGAAEPETDLSQSAAGRCGLRSVLVCLLLFSVRLCESLSGVWHVWQHDDGNAADAVAVCVHVYFPGMRRGEPLFRGIV